jgi:antitoxin (DNA-binding transcriptional repressor) of toxin-antitoxin stability system
MKDLVIPFTEAKAQLSKYARFAQQGHSTLVLKHHRAAFMIVPPDRSDQSCQKKPGIVRGHIRVSPDFDCTPDDVIADFEGMA